MDIVSNLYNFFVIRNFSGLTTIIAGAIAWYVYIAQKKDKKTSAARVILSEISTAEVRVEEVAQILLKGGYDFPSVLPVNSWNKYSNLFASDFSQEQLAEINNFYSTCEIIEEAVRRDNNYFWLTTEYRSQAAQSKLVDLIEKSLKEDSSLDQDLLQKLKESVLNTFTNDQFSYQPQKTRDMLANYITKIKKITESTNTTGIKLKELAHLSQVRFYLKLLNLEIKF